MRRSALISPNLLLKMNHPIHHHRAKLRISLTQIIIMWKQGAGWVGYLNQRKISVGGWIIYLKQQIRVTFDLIRASLVCTHPSYYDKNAPSIFFLNLKSPFSNQAVLRFLPEWPSFAKAGPTIVDWHVRLTLDTPWGSWELSASGEDKMSPIKRLKAFCCWM